jgi:hypothetical protein
LSCDIVGAFFLSVEAIKLQNIRTLRDKLISAGRDALTVRIRFSDEAENDADDQRERFFEHYVWLFTALHYVAGLLVLWGVNVVLRGRLLEWSVAAAALAIGSRPIVGIALAGVVLVLGGGVGVWLIGECVHMAFEGVVNRAVALLEFVELRALSGAVGVIGFIFLLVGFLLQEAAALLAA